ncbi:MAG: hypothetical protein ACJAVV_002128 [Alphaproteobacteria bacterium]
MSEFQIQKTNITESRIVGNDLASSPLSAGQVLVKIDKFALTANNITYAVVGEQIGYWQFFPPHSQTAQGTSVDTQGWGILPVWGFADVVSSNCEEVPVGERLFGYFPPASHLVLEPAKVGKTSWLDASAHRRELPAGYNIYRRVAHEPGYNMAHEDDRMLLFPLHITSFALFDFFQENNWFGAKQLVMLSASSKTSTGLAYGVQDFSKKQSGDEQSAPTLIGLTSARNVDMVNGINAYDTVLTYDEIAKIDNSIPTLIVDMSGNVNTLSTLHKHLGENMKFCSNVGVTHWHELGRSDDIIKERSEFFFAPSQIQKRLQEWGPQVFDQKSRKYLAVSINKSREWLNMTDLDGLEGMQAIFVDVCEGKVAPDNGLIVRMQS